MQFSEKIHESQLQVCDSAERSFEVAIKQLVAEIIELGDKLTKDARQQAHTKMVNDQLEVIVNALGSSAVLKIFAGAAPPSFDAPDPSDELAEIELPARPFHVEGGRLEVSESWVGWVHSDGVARSFRVYSGDDGVPHIQGSVGEGGDLQIEVQGGKAEVGRGQKFVIGGFTVAMDAPLQEAVR
jgi:hypothetical protein